MTLEELIAETERAIAARVSPAGFRPGIMGIWIKFVRRGSAEGRVTEEPIGSGTKLVLTVVSAADLIHHLAENLVLAVYGAEAQVTPDMPNLIVKLLDQTALVPIPGAPPLNQPNQIFLKATAERMQPNLWQALISKRRRG